MGFYKILASSYRLTNIFSSKNFKKIIIFLIIGLALFLLFSNNSFAFQNSVDVSIINNASIDSNGRIVSSDTRKIIYFLSSSDNLYSILNSSDVNKSINAIRSVPDFGLVGYRVTGLAPGQDYTFVGDGRYYYSIDIGINENVNDFVVTYSPLASSDGVVNDMVDTFSSQNLWSQFGFAVPLIGVAVLFGLGFFIVRKLIKGEGKAKVKF